MSAILHSGKVAIICDEAHRSHGGSISERINHLFGGGGGGGGGGAVGGNSGVGGNAARKPRGLAYIGLTATPSPVSLEMFGTPQSVVVAARGKAAERDTDKMFVPAHTYSMAEAVRETQSQRMYKYIEFSIFNSDLKRKLGDRCGVY